MVFSSLECPIHIASDDQGRYFLHILRSHIIISFSVCYPPPHTRVFESSTYHWYRHSSSFISVGRHALLPHTSPHRHTVKCTARMDAPLFTMPLVFIRARSSCSVHAMDIYVRRAIVFYPLISYYTFLTFGMSGMAQCAQHEQSIEQNSVFFVRLVPASACTILLFFLPSLVIMYKVDKTEAM